MMISRSMQEQLAGNSTIRLMFAEEQEMAKKGGSGSRL